MEIELKNINKIYTPGKLKVPALVDINLAIEKGDLLAIVGPSGSGKSTLMNIIGLLDHATKGELLIAGQPLDLKMPDRKLAGLRSKKIGFVFQTFNLLPRLTALQNVLLPTAYAKPQIPDRKNKAIELLKKVGLADRSMHKPTELSGGEKQRVAIARALINDPEIILADEPTGNLDSKSGQEIINILKDLNSEGKTVLIITHDEKIAKQCDKTIKIFDGKITERED